MGFRLGRRRRPNTVKNRVEDNYRVEGGKVLLAPTLHSPWSLPPCELPCFLYFFADKAPNNSTSSFLPQQFTLGPTQKWRRPAFPAPPLLSDSTPSSSLQTLALLPICRPSLSPSNAFLQGNLASNSFSAFKFFLGCIFVRSRVRVVKTEAG